MKFLERTTWVSACQGVQSNLVKTHGIHQDHTTCNRLPHQHRLQAASSRRVLKQLYSLIRSALSCVSFKNFTHSKALIDCHVNPDISKTQNDISLRWIKSDRPYPYPFNAATDRLKRKRGYLLNQPVLCVGGRADYRRLIEAAGGRFMAFRSSTQNHVSCLITLLDCAHTVICPADCISHNDFFTVKHYCQYARKNCVMLERSDLATFRKAVNILSRDNCYPSYRSG